MLERIDPTANNIEPVYLYDDPTAHPIALSGHWILQKGLGRIRSIRTTPADVDRFCSVPLLNHSSNLDYATAWTAGAMITYQRTLDIPNISRITTWWDRNDTLSPNNPLIWVPAGPLGMAFDGGQGQCLGQICPSSWTKIICACGEDATQYGIGFADWSFDHCRACGEVWRPANIIDGQHRIRGMADRNPPSGLPRCDEHIFVSLVTAQGPGAVNQMSSARMFIEINGGAKPLGTMHKHYLASHYRILEYEEPMRRLAFEIAANLNTPAGLATDEWYQDTGAYNQGRVQLMENTPNCDFLPAWRIADVVRDTYDRNFEMINAGGAIAASKVYDAGVNPVGPALALLYQQHLGEYLRAITETWPGGAGPRSMPAWQENRSATGYLQTGAVLRTLFNLYPFICLRVSRNGLALNAVNFQNELSTFANVSWTGLWSSSTGWLTGDGGIGKMSHIMIELLKYVPIGAAPTPGGRWLAVGGTPDLTDWIGGAHDSFTIANLIANPATLAFDCETVVGILPGETRSTSLLGSEPCILRIIHLRAGAVMNNHEIQHKLDPTGTNTIDIAAIGIIAAVGDVLEVSVSSITPYNDTVVWDNDTIAGASNTIIV
jgi:hypothetical protein